MLLDLALDLAHALDPVAFVQDRLKFEPDPWQARLLRSCAPWILLNCCRQSGKSTTMAAVALHTAIYDPGLILLVSPSLRQSKELFTKVIGFLKDLEPAEVLEEDNKSSCTLANSARVVSLPGDPDTLRGYSAPKLIIKDEASYVSDAMQAALDPMLAVSKGRLIEMSSPNGKRGHFYENWQGGIDVERIKIIGRECPRSPGQAGRVGRAGPCRRARRHDPGAAGPWPAAERPSARDRQHPEGAVQHPAQS